jgi:hypothetical protein
VEAVMRDDDGDVLVEGPYDLPCRVDAMPIEEDDELGEPVMVDTPTSLSFPELTLDWSGNTIYVKPFGWDYAGFVAEFDKLPDWKPLTDWFWHHFDADDENEESPEGLYLSDPEFEDGKASFVVDFGSAPVPAFQTLIQVLHEMGASCVRVGYPDFASPQPG